MNIESYIERSKEFDSKKADFIADVKDIVFDEGATLSRIIVPDDLWNANIALPLTEWSLQQACEKLGPPPMGYMRQCPPDLIAYNLNYWVAKNHKDRAWMVRSYGEDCRAIVSAQYIPVMNTFVLETARDYLEGVDYKIAAPFVSPDDLHINFMYKDFNGGSYRAGVHLDNGETGKTLLRIAPSIQVTACTNSIHWTKGGVEQKHYHTTLGFMKGLLKENLGQLFNVSIEMVEAAVAAEVERIPEVGDVISQICKEKGYSEDIERNALLGTEGEKTLMGLVNGFTYAAHELDDVDKALELENLGGAILMDRNSVFSHKVQEIIS